MLCFAGNTFAGNIELAGIADGDSRWFFTSADAFGQLDQGYDDGQGGGPDPSLDGFFRISGESGVTIPTLSTFDPRSFNPSSFEIDLAPGVSGQQGSGVDLFPNEADFDDLGTLIYDGTATGSGVETFDLTDYTGLQFNQYIADNDTNFEASLGTNTYTTEVNNVTGTVTFTDGVVTSLEMASEIVFTYVNVLNNTGDAVYTGTFTFSGDQFDLLVDDTARNNRFIWDSTGTIVVIPEPSVLALLIGGFAFTARRKRKR
ncbi:MAG: PEP-CTERM sorting domain-containing protein [Planctomycetota bacterium]